MSFKKAYKKGNLREIMMIGMALCEPIGLKKSIFTGNDVIQINARQRFI